MDYSRKQANLKEFWRRIPLRPRPGFLENDFTRRLHALKRIRTTFHMKILSHSYYIHFKRVARFFDSGGPDLFPKRAALRK